MEFRKPWLAASSDSIHNSTTTLLDFSPCLQCYEIYSALYYQSIAVVNMID